MSKPLVGCRVTFWLMPGHSLPLADRTITNTTSKPIPLQGTWGKGGVIEDIREAKPLAPAASRT